jgi:hypothetical protein
MKALRRASAGAGCFFSRPIVESRLARRPMSKITVNLAGGRHDHRQSELGGSDAKSVKRKRCPPGEASQL